MQSYARSLSLTAAITMAAVVAVLLGAAPQEKPSTDRETARGAMTLAPAPARPKADAPPPAPITFADPDGQELILEELSVRTAIHGMLSLTELELRFRNPQSRVIEGRFSCTLPPNAAISRFAKEVNGQLMEGEVVERLRANQVYEQFLHQMRDPALLEQDQGNRFSARIFPIEPNAPVRLLLSYTTLLPLREGTRTYTLPLRGMSKVNKLTFRAFVTPIPTAAAQGQLTKSTAEVTSFDQQNWTPDRDIVLTSRDEGGGPLVLRASDFYLAALRPNVSTAKRQASTSNWLFYIDTSASSAEGASHRIRALSALLEALPPSDDVELVAFDNEVVPLSRGSASEVSRTIPTLLNKRLFLGGTDVNAMLHDLASRATKDPSRTTVIASDLVATLGTTAAHDLQNTIAKLPANARVHALILGSREDAPTAKAITARRGRVIRVPFTDALATHAANAAADLRRPLGESIDIADDGAEWIYPTHFDDVAPGDEVLVLGKVRGGDEPRIASTPALRLDSSTFAPLLEREAYRAYLEYLAGREANETTEAVRRALSAEQVKISIEQRVVIPRTTMLVLESEADYARFGLDRRALAQILTIDAGGIGRLDRPKIQIASRPAEARKRLPAVSTPPPAARAMAAPRIEAFAEADVEEPEGVTGSVEGGVEGGVVGGVVGGVAGGMVATRDSAAVQADEVPPLRVASSPRPVTVPAPVAAVPPLSGDADISWLRQQKPPRSAIAQYEATLRDNPRDREVYNQLSEALAAYDEWSELRRLALRWQPFDPENPQVYEVLGMASDALGYESEAARAFASLIEIAPAKTELLQRAGLLLLRTRSARLAETPLRKALEVRPDRANGYRHLALMLWREGRFEEAARVLESATRRTFPQWYGNVQRVIHEELGSIYRGWMKNDPERRAEIANRAQEHNVDLERRDALRITLAWETDANDVDLHVVDPAGEVCFYQHKETRSGLALYEDITQGLGPEVIRASSIDRGTYHVGVRYFAAGPMGISRGLVVVVRNDDQLEIHPFRLTQGGGEIRYVTGVGMK
ncbi:MAG TPA: VIT domain-containing protein [Thermoanaerobaculia bacterium]|nr:VIT domain-containing protein [Thermoanaerobaculia bacterium]